MVVVNAVLRYASLDVWRRVRSHLLMLVGGRTCLGGGGTPHPHAWELLCRGDLEVSSRQTVSEEDMTYSEDEDIPQIHDAPHEEHPSWNQRVRIRPRALAEDRTCWVA